MAGHSSVSHTAEFTAYSIICLLTHYSCIRDEEEYSGPHWRKKRFSPLLETVSMKDNPRALYILRRSVKT